MPSGADQPSAKSITGNVETSEEDSDEQYRADPTLCTNCNCILLKVGKRLGAVSESDKNKFYFKDVADFVSGQSLDVEGCRLCRLIQNASTARIENPGGYPTFVIMSLQSAWGGKLWMVEFRDNTSNVFGFATAFLLPVNDDPGKLDISSWVSNGGTLDCVRQWLEDCKQHSGCRKETMAHAPSRLIEVGTLSIRPRLRNTVEISPSARYATLSHCWGSHIPVKLLDSNVESFRRGIDFAGLSKTFQEAICTARHLNIPYIWIDSLCIIQDNPSDWANEASKMCAVYSSSYVNLAAASSTDGRQGLFSPRSPSHHEDMRSQFDIGGTQYRIVDASHWANNVDKSPLLTRAWVSQERLLSPRTVYFGKYGLAWECAHQRLSETYPIKVPATNIQRFNNELGPWIQASQLHVSGPQLNHTAHIIERWKTVVSQYSTGHLTFPTDRLIALSGVAQRFQLMLKSSSYVAGLWLDSILDQLLWHVRTGSEALPENMPYIAPSWSWASIAGGSKVDFLKPSGHLQTYVASLLATKTVLMHEGNPFGQLQRGGYIQLLAPLFSATLVYHRERECRTPMGQSKYEIHIQGTQCEWNDKEKILADNSPLPPRVSFYPDITLRGKEDGTKNNALVCVIISKTVYPRTVWSGTEEEEKSQHTCFTGLILRKTGLLGEKKVFTRWGAWRVDQTDIADYWGVLDGARRVFDEKRAETGLVCKEDESGVFLYDVTIV